MWFTEVLKNSILITGLVMVMMFLIEYIYVFSGGSTLEKLRHKPFLQIILSALLGFIPGCGGGFIVVSLYAHNMVSFGALLAMMIATMGDESFLLFAMIPQTALLLSVGLLLLAIAAGWLAHRFLPGVQRPLEENHFVLHQDHDHPHGNARIWGRLRENFHHISWQRVLLLLGLLVFFVAIAFGFLEHEHEHHPHDHGTLSLFSERWLNLLFAGLSLATFVFTLKANNHFIEEHLWEHTIKQHFLKIFLWTFGALLVIEGLLHYVDLHAWMQDNYWLMLLGAILIGCIPESGPHVLFITLFATGQIPLSILAANCLVQDGHAGLPLLAETKKGFVYAKALKMVLAVATALLLKQFTGS